MSLKKITIVTGNDIVEKLQLYKSGATFDIPVTSTVQAAIVSRDKSKRLAGPFTLLNTDEGAVWSTSLVSFLVDASQLTGLTRSHAKIQVQVDDAGSKESWFFDAEIVQGNIP